MPHHVLSRSAPTYSGTSSAHTPLLHPPADRYHPANDHPKTQPFLGSSSLPASEASLFLTSKDSQLPPPLRVNLPTAQVPCKYFATGYCRRGSKCLFNHTLEQLKLQKVQLRPVLDSTSDIPQQEPRLSDTYMVKGNGKQALTLWRAESWKFHIARAKAVQSERDECESRHSKVMLDVERLLAKNDGIGDSARRVAASKIARKIIVVSGNSEGMAHVLGINHITETDFLTRP